MTGWRLHWSRWWRGPTMTLVKIQAGWLTDEVLYPRWVVLALAGIILVLGWLVFGLVASRR